MVRSMRVLSVREILLPNKKLIVLYLVVSVLLLALNTRFVLSQIDQLEVANQAAMPVIRSVYIQMSETINQNLRLSRLALGLFWGAIGAVVYVLFWIAGNAMREMRNTMVEELFFVKPSKASLWRGRLAIAAHVVYRIAIFVLLAGFGLVVVMYILPFSIAAVRAFLASPTDTDGIINGALSLLGLMVGLHGLIVLFRLLNLRDTLSRHIA